MTKSIELSCEEFVETLASKAPAPGGGGAAALVGAIGAALGHMVGALTVDKPKYAAQREEVIALMNDVEALQGEFLDFVEEDARAFEPLSRAYGLPASTDEERTHKEDVMEACLREACMVPLEIMHACGRAAELFERFAVVGTPLAISDVGCGAAFCRAALQAANLNVLVNTKLMRDRAFASATNDAALELMEECTAQLDALVGSVEEHLR